MAAIIRIESNGNPNAIGADQDTGLMQVMPREAGYARPTQAALLDPDTNIEWGVKILHDGLVYFEWNIPLALGEYNEGRTNARNRTPKSVRYANMVLAEYAKAVEARDVRYESEGIHLAGARYY